jgi:hypothetical protein
MDHALPPWNDDAAKRGSVDAMRSMADEHADTLGPPACRLTTFDNGRDRAVQGASRRSQPPLVVRGAWWPSGTLPYAPQPLEATAAGRLCSDWGRLRERLRPSD